MTFFEYIPLISGLLIPLSTVINLQSITVPFPQGRSEYSIIHGLSIFAFVCGIVATISLFVRMLEKKIKWTSRLLIFGSILQSVFLFLSLVSYQLWKTKSDSLNIEVIFHRTISCIGSMAAGTLYGYHIMKNTNQVYSWTLYDLSIEQRQLILLTISSFGWIICSAAFYCHLENWPFERGLYWSFCSFTTIGFGDYAPKSVMGIAFVPVITLIGIGLVGGQVWSLRNVFLEFLAVTIANQYSIFINNDAVTKDDNASSNDLFAVASSSNEIPTRILANDSADVGSTSNIGITRSPRMNIPGRDSNQKVDFVVLPPAFSLPSASIFQVSSDTVEHPNRATNRRQSIADGRSKLSRTYTITRSRT
jgi:hypothetical protein